LQKTRFEIILKIKRLSAGTLVASISATNEKEAAEMRKLATKTSYIGAGVGLVLFAIIGLVPGSLLGGVMGLNIAGSLFGFPVASGVLQRIIVAASMLIGVMVSGIIFVMGSAAIGWVLGTATEKLLGPEEAPVPKSADLGK